MSMDNVGLARELRRLAGRRFPSDGSEGVLLDAADRLESDAQAIEEAEEILSEVSIGLAWSVGEAEPPRPCSDDCRLPHLGPRARRAITGGLAALGECAWNPPGREGS